MNIMHGRFGPIQTNCYIVSDDEKNCAIIDPGAEANRINKILEEICGKVFDYTAMSRVRLFNDIHSDTTDITFTEKVRKYYANPSVLDSSRVVKIKAEYRAWMNMYYPNEEVK